MKRVVIESPYAGDVDSNKQYLAECIHDSLSRGEAPFASHAIFPQFLDDTNLEQRETGMSAGFEWGRFAESVAVYTDRGISPGMQAGIFRAQRQCIPIEYRSVRFGGVK